VSLTTAVATNEMPKLQVLAGFGATSANFPWTDISQFVRSGSINRSSNRLAGPLYTYQAGTCTLVLKNGDARFDPDNLSGPYVTTQGLQSITETITAPDTGSTSNTGGNQGGLSTGQSVTGTFTVPSNINGSTIAVQCWAAGGGGGTGSNITQAAEGGGGGGGEFAAEAALAVTPGVTYTYTIGLAGLGGGDVTGSSAGLPGGDTTFTGDSVTVHAHGGQGGAHGSATGSGGSTGQTQGVGGARGSGSVNSQNNPGGAGGPGGQNSSGTTASGGGGGGSGGNGAPGNVGGTGDGKNPTPGGVAVISGGPGGAGGQPKNNGSAPQTQPGGGGGGGSGERDGGNGAPGQIVLSYTVVVASSARTEVIPETPIRVVGAYARNATVNFENGVGTWTPGNSATLTQDATYSLWGQNSMKITPDGVHAIPQAQSEMCQAGTASVISGSIWAFTPNGIAHSVKLDINYYDANQSLLQNDGGISVTLLAGIWTQVTNYNNSPPPNGTVYFALLFKINGTPAASEIVWVDQAVGAPGLAASAYPLFTGYADSWQDTGILNPNDPAGPQTGPYQGYAETNLTATDAFEAFSLANLATLTNPVDSGDNAGGRIGLILQSIGWPPGLQQIDTSPVIVQGSDYGDNALDLMQTAATTDGGDLFMDGAGNVVFFTRNHVLSATTSVQVQAVFGDRPGTVEPNGTELPYEGIARITDNTTLFNDVQITPVSGVDPAASGVGGLEEVTDQSAVAQFLFLRSYTNSGTIQMFQADALSLAQWILYIAKDDEDRIDQLTINPQRAPGDMYIQALGRQFTDRIEVWRRPAGMISPIVKPMGIRGITHTWDFSARTWVTSWTLQDYTKYSSFLRLDDLTSGRLGYNAVAWG
jgi:hypothetical protein